VFTKDYSTPIEENDCFQKEFRFASNSVMLKVYSEIIWSFLIIIYEFIFSLQYIQMRLRNEFDSDWLVDYVAENKLFSAILFYLRASFIITSTIKTLAIKSTFKKTHYMQVFYNLAIGITFLQIVIYPLFLWDEFWFFNVTEMLFVTNIIVYAVYNALSLNEVGVILRIFAKMTSVVVIFGTVSCLVITVIAYPIHTVFLEFSQPIVGQIYSDLNLFSDLYQGILTCFEFVFGAVVLVRPYIEENWYTYSMTFIMMMFAFFGNIMLANMLIAFLTSSFDEITRNATYLTMNMQFELIRVFKKSEVDSIMSLPYPLFVIALPFYILMAKKDKSRAEYNRMVKKIIHVTNTFLPTFIYTFCCLVIVFFARYLEITLYLVLRIFHRKGKNLFFLFCWIFGGPILLSKLFAQDISTMCQVMLSFNKKESNELDYDLNDEARANLVDIFVKFNRIIQHRCTGKNETVVSLKEFEKDYSVISVQEAFLKGFTMLRDDPKSVEKPFKVSNYRAASSLHIDPAYADFNSKYCMPGSVLAPLLLKKYAYSDPRSDNPFELKINLLFMFEKCTNNINPENIGRLIAFEKKTQDKAAHGLKRSNDEEEMERDFKEVREGMVGLEARLHRVINEVRISKGLINK
jgi:hypothetical protein